MKILITGANRGLGLAIADYALRQGDTVIATERTTSKALQELGAKYSNSLHVLQFDLIDEEAIASEKDRLTQQLDVIDVIINNAGMLNGREQTIENLDFEACLTAFNINTLGPARIVKHFLPLLRKGEQKTIMNVSSNSASLTNAYPNDYPYGFSKTSLNVLTEKLVRELKDDQVNVLSVHPGWMQTDMGGQEADLDPNDPAKKMYHLIENLPKSTTGFQFFDYEGEMMEI